MKNNLFAYELTTIRKWIDGSAQISWDIVDSLWTCFKASIEKQRLLNITVAEKVYSMYDVFTDFMLLLNIAQSKKADDTIIVLLRNCLLALRIEKDIEERYPSSSPATIPALTLNPDYSRTALLELLKKLSDLNFFRDREGNKCGFAEIVRQFSRFLSVDLHNHRQMMFSTGFRYKQPFIEEWELPLPTKVDTNK